MSFGECRHCLPAGPTTDGCFECLLAAVDEAEYSRCPVCSGDKGAGFSYCSTTLCRQRLVRRFNRNYTVVIHEPTLYQAILHCKHSTHPTWMPVLARILVGYLDANPEFKRFDVIMSAPAHLGPDGAEYGHSRALVRAASVLAAGRWPFATSGEGPVVKTAPTDRMSDHDGAEDRDAVAKQLKGVLRLAPGADVRGRRYLVVDDVFTRGNTLNATADVLKNAGAVEVCGLSLIRKNKPPRLSE